jgi:multidrug resistance efflux pump
VAFDPFAATDQQLARDRVRQQALLLGIPLLLAMGWAAWMFFAHVSVYASTDQARVEVAQAAFFVQAPVAGRVSKSYLELGKQVDPGTVLVELEAGPQQLRVQEEQEHQAALEAELANLHQSLGTEQRTLVDEKLAGDSATQQARAALAGAEEAVRFGQEDAKRKSEMYKDGLASELDFLRAQSDVKKKQTDLDAARTAVGRSQHEQLIHGGERRVQMESIGRDIVRIEGDLATSRDTVERLQHDLGSQRIVASGRGRLGEIVNLRAGAFVHEGDRLAAIIPDGRLRIVAYFEPRNAIGLVRKGQRGWLRLDGFPWTEYGSVMAYVTNVGDEVRDGRVRVELSLRTNPRVLLQHGLPGTLEVEVDRVTPASFLLRKAGGLLAAPQKIEAASTETASQ